MNDLDRAAARAGLDLKAVGPDNLRRAISRAMERLGLSDPEHYLSLLANDPSERRLLAGEAVVQETWLFRDPEAYAGLARLAPTFKQPVRILSVPCATGEEPVSIALTLLRAGMAPNQFLVDAADANPLALATARAGRFGPASFRGQARSGFPFFKSEGQDVVLDRAVLKRIRFLEADVLEQSFLAHEPPYQVIFCRHLLIYLAPPARLSLAGTLKRLLGGDGILFTTPAEAVAFMSLGLTSYPRAPAFVAPNGSLAPGPSVPAVSASVASAQGVPDEAPPAKAPGLKPCSGRDAQALADAGRLEEALACVNEALSQSPPTAGLYHLKGATLLAQGREDQAEEAFRRALYLDPGHLESLTHLELLCRAKGRPDEAALLGNRAKRAGETVS